MPRKKLTHIPKANGVTAVLNQTHTEKRYRLEVSQTWVQLTYCVTGQFLYLLWTSTSSFFFFSQLLQQVLHDSLCYHLCLCIAYSPHSDQDDPSNMQEWACVGQLLKGTHETTWDYKFMRRHMRLQIPSLLLPLTLSTITFSFAHSMSDGQDGLQRSGKLSPSGFSTGDSSAQDEFLLNSLNVFLKVTLFLKPNLNMQDCNPLLFTPIPTYLLHVFHSPNHL